MFACAPVSILQSISDSEVLIDINHAVWSSWFEHISMLHCLSVVLFCV